MCAAMNNTIDSIGASPCTQVRCPYPGQPRHCALTREPTHQLRENVRGASEYVAKYASAGLEIAVALIVEEYLRVLTGAQKPAF